MGINVIVHVGSSPEIFVTILAEVLLVESASSRVWFVAQEAVEILNPIWVFLTFASEGEKSFIVRYILKVPIVLGRTDL